METCDLVVGSMAAMEDRETERLIACHECDALFPRFLLPQGCEARCSCCGAVLARCKATGPEHSVAWALAGLLLWIGANASPFMLFTMAGSTQASLLSEGSVQLAEAGRWGLAILVLICAIVVPLLRLLALLWLQVPLLLGKRVWFKSLVWRAARRMEAWGMLDVFLLGAFVALVKFGDYGEIALGRGFAAFVGLVVASAAAHACFDSERVWAAEAVS